MGFVTRKIEEKKLPFLKEKGFKSPKPKVFFGPEIIKASQQSHIFSKNLFIWLVILTISLVYLILCLINLFLPPKIIIDFPPENYITSEKIITIKGRVSSQNAIIMINNQLVNLKNKNIFEEKVSLLPGINKLKISVQKKFGPARVIFRQIIVK